MVYTLCNNGSFVGAVDHDDGRGSEIEVSLLNLVPPTEQSHVICIIRFPSPDDDSVDDGE